MSDKLAIDISDDVYSTDLGTDSGTVNWISQGLVGTLALDLSSVSNGHGSITGAVGSNTIWTTTTTGTGGYNWTIPSAPTTISQGGRISLQGESADIDINGRSMSAWMAKVEERLNILIPNPELEREWDELRRLGERYRKLEKKCQEKAEMWKQLKKMPAPRPDQF